MIRQEQDERALAAQVHKYGPGHGKTAESIGTGLLQHICLCIGHKCLCLAAIMPELELICALVLKRA